MPEKKHSSLLIYQASAGSGKTYTIVKEYLSLLLDVSENGLETRLRSLLAITFTNKAAAEMKERVLYALQRLSTGDTTLYPELWTTYPDLSTRSQRVLHYLLHHYSFFTITTIDSFLTRLAQSVAFELGIPFRFDVLLDKKALFEEILSEILDQFGKDEKITDLLEDVITYSLEKNSSSIEKELLKKAHTIYKETNYLALYPLLNDNLIHYNSTLYKHIKDTFFSLSQKRKEIAQKVIKTLPQGIQKEDLSYKGGGNLSFFERIINNENDDLKYESDRLDKWTKDPPTTEKEKKIAQWKKEEVDPALAELRWRKGKENVELLFRTYEALITHLFSLALMNTFQSILERKIWTTQRIPLEEFGRRLHQNISEAMVPYLYIRLGERYRYFFIDEFQDTSRLQWENLSPLIEEAIASGGKAYLVGDPKQAIYRWRNGDVRIMLSEVTKKFPHQTTSISLDTNYRSRKTIVEFVNQYFADLLTRISTQDSSQNSHSFFAKSYENMKQEAHRNEEGLVSFDFEILSKKDKKNKENSSEENNSEENNEEENLSSLVSWCKTKIEQAKNHGYAYRDIAILVRKNKTASLLASALLEQDIPVISEDALFVASSQAVRLVMASLRFLVRPTDLNAILTFLHLYGEVFSSPIDADILKEFFEKLTSSNQTLPSLEKISQNTASYKDKHSAFSFVSQLLDKRLSLFTLTLPDLGEEIIRLLSLSQQQGHYVFFAKLLDVLREFSLKKTGSIADFLTTWDEELSLSLTIDPDPSADAVRLMSIHKAKGLEFPVVLFPFLSEKARNDKDIIGPWPSLSHHCISPTPPSSWLYRMKETLTYVPGVDKTYEEEKDLSLLDEVNILYVAFTRARDVLSVYVSFEEKKDFSSFSADTWKNDLKEFLKGKKEDLEKKLGYLTLDLISSMSSPFLSISCEKLSDTYLLFSTGKWPQKEKTPSPHPHETLTHFPSSPWQKKMRVHRHEAEIHLLFHERQRQSQEEGIILHELLARVFKESDIETIIKDYANSLPGSLSDTQQNELKNLLSEIWNLFIQKGWTKGFSIHNEETLLTPAGLIRPDKIFLAEDKNQAIVVDYKSGLQSEEKDKQSILSRYQGQLKTYCDAIQKMGYTKVEGYVLLISSRELHKVV